VDYTHDRIKTFRPSAVNVGIYRPYYLVLIFLRVYLIGR